VDEKGLSSEEATERLKKYGENILEMKKKSVYLSLFSFFWGPIPWMIEIAALLSALLERWVDFGMIIALLFINTILGFFQELKANNAIEALKQRLALKARVLRDGTWQNIRASLLVPGDIVFIKLGNIIPADVELISGEYLSVDQSSLTGESFPVNKKVGDQAFSGTTAKLGEMIGRVTKTGLNTFFGKTAQLVASAKTTSHFQQAVLRIGRFLIFLTLGIAAIILIVSLLSTTITESLHLSLGNLTIFLLVLIISGIPVAMPAVLSMTMAIGAGRMAKLKAIVSKLIAIEELAGMEILCADKTGTLTKNELSVGEIVSYAGSDDDVLFHAALTSDLTGEDAIDSAIIAKMQNLDEVKKHKVEKFIPFDPVRKRTESYLTTPGGKKLHVTKGAPQIVLKMTNPDAPFSDKVIAEVEAFAKRGFRTLGVAKEDEGGWTFLGLISLSDPTCADTHQTIAHLQKMGIDIKMLTGDHLAIAKELSSNLNLGSHVVPAREITDKMIEYADGFAEIFPEHKFEIVKDYQKSGHIVGMTGDGVNDAPALKQADVGIAVWNATDAARAAADLVLTKPGLMVIKKAIKEARFIFGRMKSYAMYRISETCRLLFFLFLSMILLQDQPLTSVMIILVALLNDLPIMMIAYDHMRDETQPVSWNMTETFTISIGLASIGVLSTFGLYWIGLELWDFDLTHARTLAFLAILCGGNLTIYLTRNVGNLFDKPLPEWKFFLATLSSQIIGTLVAVYGLGTEDFVGIGWKYVGWSWLYIAIWFAICILTKKALYKFITFTRGSDVRFIKKTSTSFYSDYPRE